MPFLLQQTAVDWHLNGNFFSSYFLIGSVLIRFGFNTAQVYHWIKPGMIKRKRWVEGGSWLFLGDGREGARLRRMESDLPFSSVNVDLCGRRRAVGRMSERPGHLGTLPLSFFPITRMQRRGQSGRDPSPLGPSVLSLLRTWNIHAERGSIDSTSDAGSTYASFPPAKVEHKSHSAYITKQ